MKRSDGSSLVIGTAHAQRARARRGAVLLEIVLALGLFVATAMTLLGVVSGAIDSLTRSRDQLIGADHARNALAMIEAGIARPESLNGPVPAWSGGGDAAEDWMGNEDPEAPAGAFGGAMDAGSAFDESQPASGDLVTTGWALEIETEPARVPGLTLVTVRAHRVDNAGDEVMGGASVTLRQIVAFDAGSESQSPMDDDALFGSGFDDGGGMP